MKKIRPTYDCAIIGGGPGGLVSALYLLRYWRSVVIFDASDSRLAPVPKVKNLAGFAKGISGKSLLHHLHRQIKPYSPKIINETAQIQRHGSIFKITSKSHQIHVKKVVLAGGMKDKQPKIPNFRKLCQQGVLAYCPICEGFDHRKEDIGIIVDSAQCLGKIKFISYYSDNVHIIMTRNFRWSLKARQFFKKKNIVVSRGTLESLEKVPRTGRLEVKYKKRKPFQVKMAYVELGSEVNFPAVEGLRRDRDGFIYTDGHQRTSIPGVFAVGDCVKSLSQISVALGQAAVAATRIHNDLLNEDA